MSCGLIVDARDVLKKLSNGVRENIFRPKNAT